MFVMTKPPKKIKQEFLLLYVRVYREAANKSEYQFIINGERGAWSCCSGRRLRAETACAEDLTQSPEIVV